MSNSTFRRRRLVRRVVALVLIATFAILAIGYYVPRGQLLAQTLVNLSIALETYIQAHGVMPSSLDDLEAGGVGQAGSDGKYIVVSTGHVLYYLGAITVAWGIDPGAVHLQDGQLYDRTTGEPVLIVQAKMPFALGF